MSDQNTSIKDSTLQEIEILAKNCLQKVDETNDVENFEEVINFINEKYEPIDEFDEIAYRLSIILVEYGCSKYDNINILLEVIFMLTIKIDHKFVSNDYIRVTGGMVILEHIHLQIAEGRNGTWVCLPGNLNLLKHMKPIYGRREFPDNPVIKGDETDEAIIEYINEINMAREKHRNFWIFYPRLTKCRKDGLDDLIIRDANFIYNKLEKIYKNTNDNNNNSDDDDIDTILFESYIEELCSILYEYGSEFIKYKGEESINKYYNILKTLLTKPIISLEAKNTIAKALKSKINNFENPSFDKVSKSARLEEFRNTIKRFS
ncbi:unnamed protein product [Cunninghamella blakesleeana]